MPFIPSESDWEFSEPPPSAQPCFDDSHADEDYSASPTRDRDSVRFENESLLSWSSDEIEPACAKPGDHAPESELEIGSDDDLDRPDDMPVEEEDAGNSHTSEAVKAVPTPAPVPSTAQPQASQSKSHFAKFANFTPDDRAGFEDEFSRLASSQKWKPGSQEYVRQRTIAIREELETLYFTQPPPALAAIKEEPASQEDDVEVITAEEFYQIKSCPRSQGPCRNTNLVVDMELRGYQDLCREVGLEPGVDVKECEGRLKATLVNIVDLIDARRTGKKVEVWTDFEAFRAYTLQPKHRIHAGEAKNTVLASLLQRLKSPDRNRWPRRPGKICGEGGMVRRVRSGRVTKSRH